MSRFTSFSSLLVGLPVAAILWGTTVCLSLTRNPPALYRASPWEQMPSPEFLQKVALGQNTTLAGFLWIDCLLEYAGAFLEDRELPHLEKRLQTVVTLNPRMESVYLFGGLILSEEPSGLGKAIRLYEQGMHAYPNNYKFRLFAGLNRLALDSNYRAAAQYLEPIAENAQVPLYVRGLYATLLQKGGESQDAFLFLIESYYQAPDPWQRRILAQKILKLVEKPLSLQDLESLLSRAAANPGEVKTVLKLIQTGPGVLKSGAARE